MDLNVAPSLARAAICTAAGVILAIQPGVLAAQRSMSASQPNRPADQLDISAPRGGVEAATSGDSLVDLGRLDLSNKKRSELRSAVEAGDWRRAEFLLAEEAGSRSDSSEVLKALGAVNFQNGHYLESAIAYKKADRIAGLDERSRFTLATAFIALERGHWARPEIEKLAAMHPQNPVYPHWLAGVYYSYQWFDEAIVELEKALTLDPNFAAAHDRLGLCFEGLGQTDSALMEYETAAGLIKRSGTRWPWPLFHLGSLLHDRGRLEEAEKALRQSLKYQPDFPEGHYELGAVLEKQGKSGEAVKLLLRAAELDAGNPKPHYALSQIYRRLGQTAKAMDEIQKFRELSGK